jgi:G patch domain and KOW motifs-containing protein
LKKIRYMKLGRIFLILIEMDTKVSFTLGHARPSIALEKVDTKHFIAPEKEKQKAIEVTSLSDIKNLASSKHVVAPIPMITQNTWRDSATKGEVSRSASSLSSISSTTTTSDTPLPILEAAAAPIRSLEQEAVDALLSQTDTELSKKTGPLPILMRNAVPGIETLETETDKFRHDVSLRPDEVEPDDSSYDERPIEDFGYGMLLGMGWKEGQGIGGKNRKVVDAIEFMPRGHLLGLGADPSANMPPPPSRAGQKIQKPGEPKEVVMLRVAPDEEGKIRHFKTIHDRLIPVASLAMRVGALIEVTSGVHSGMFGRVTDTGDSSVEEARRTITFRLTVNEEVVSAKRYEVQVLDPHALPKDHIALQAPGSQKLKSPEPFGSSRSSGSSESKRSSESNSSKPTKRSKRSESSDEDSDSSSSENNKKKKKDKKSKSSSLSSTKSIWVQMNTRVRVISSSLASGRFYNMKGVVVDFSTPERFTLRMDGSGTLVENVKQKAVETYLPKAAGKLAQGSAGANWPQKVQVVKGEHRRLVGVLLEKSKDKALVQLDQDLELVTLGFDFITEYVG